MSKRAPHDHPIHDLIAERWSPVVFDARPVEPTVLLRLFEAARWAPSSFNEQPWSWIVGRKGEGTAWQGVFDCLAEGNKPWAQHAPVLVLGVASRTFARNDKPNRHAFYDLGQAMATLVVQATAEGLVAHQMAGFRPQEARATFAVPETHEVVVAMALGHLGDAARADDALSARDTGVRSRKPLEELLVGDRWGEPPAFLEDV
jgi:nitroreductase